MKFRFGIRWRFLVGCVLVLFAGVIIVERVVVLKVHEITHPPRSSEYVMIDAAGTPMKPLKITTEDDLDLTAWYIPSKNGATIVVQHGYKANSAGMLAIGQMLARHGFGVFWFDFRAHGKSEGDHVTFGLDEVKDTHAAVWYLRDQNEVDGDRIGVLGTSMGGATGILAAAENKNIRALAVEAVFAELKDEVAIGIQVQTRLPAKPLDAIFLFFAERQPGVHLGAVAPVAKIHQISPRPILIMQGGNDARILPDAGQRLYDAARQPKEYWHEPTAAHGALFKAVPQEYEKRVVDFFSKYLLDGATP
jgi:fermentation-respiration switch protein FrsA (DUF1100 family)